ncbi:MAG: AAA family ATPase, partial [Planctomycetota bacterium]|jgi:pilus assembly protein CpaE
MISGSDILLVTKEEATANTIKSVIDESEGLTLAGICQEVSELRSYLSNKKVQAVVVDIDPDPSQVLHSLSAILTAYPETYVVVVCSSFTKKLVVQAMQAGARHFLEKETIPSELSKELQQLIHDDRKKGAGLGSVISVFSAGGGCGATTVAINLASELRLLASKPVLTIDLDSFYGTMSTYLGIKTRYGISDVLSHKGLIDKHLITSSAYSYMEGFHVLSSPASIESPRTKSLKVENLPTALEACRQVYGYTVIDAPRMPERTTTNLASLSDVILIVFQLTVKDVNFARSMVLSLTKSGIAGEKIISLANRVKKRGPLVRLEDSKKAVGLNSCLTIRSDWRKAMKSVNRGQPLAHIARSSSLRKDYRKLAAKVRGYGVNSSSKISR